MPCNKEYEEAEEQEIIRVYGEFSDETITKFVKSGLAKKFYDKYLQEHHIKSLIENIE